MVERCGVRGRMVAYSIEHAAALARAGRPIPVPLPTARARFRGVLYASPPPSALDLAKAEALAARYARAADRQRRAGSVAGRRELRALLSHLRRMLDGGGRLAWLRRALLPNPFRAATAYDVHALLAFLTLRESPSRVSVALPEADALHLEGST